MRTQPAAVPRCRRAGGYVGGAVAGLLNEPWSRENGAGLPIIGVSRQRQSDLLGHLVQIAADESEHPPAKRRALPTDDALAGARPRHSEPRATWRPVRLSRVVAPGAISPSSISSESTCRARVSSMPQC